jgi:hypothetical protein
MAHDDWRIRIELPPQTRIFDVPVDLSDEARGLARRLEGRRLAVSRDGDTLFVYAPSRLEAERAHAVIESVLRDQQIEAREGAVERWLPGEERWSDETPGPTIEEELLERGYAPWEVRVALPTREAAHALAERLEAEGRDVARRFRYLVIGAQSRDDAKELAARVGGEVEPGGELVWEVTPHNPLAWFGGLGGTGTPL